jgi:hypothetical protein
MSPITAHVCGNSVSRHTPDRFVEAWRRVIILLYCFQRSLALWDGNNELLRYFQSNASSSHLSMIRKGLEIFASHNAQNKF